MYTVKLCVRGQCISSIFIYSSLPASQDEEPEVQEGDEDEVDNEDYNGGYDTGGYAQDQYAQVGGYTTVVQGQ